MNSLRRRLYYFASLIGDFNAIKNGKIIQRLIRK